MNIKLTEEIILGDKDKEAAAAQRQAAIKKGGRLMDINWISCDNRPAVTTACLIAYADGALDIGAYHAVQGFDRGGFFSSPHEFSAAHRRIRPEYWLPIPFLPAAKRTVA